MTDRDIQIELETTSGSDFFAVFKRHLKIKIPLTLKNILSFNHYDSIYTLSEFNEASVNEIQDCMRNIFEKDMIDAEENMGDYLGKFEKVQKKFILVSGELRLIHGMVQTCQRLYKLAPEVNASGRESLQLGEDEIEVDKLNLCDVFRPGFLNQESLSGLIISEELEIKITPRKKDIDGSRSYFMHCPVEGCDEQFIISYKGYRQYYKHKKANSKIPKVGKSRWHNLTQMKSHILKNHVAQSADDVGNGNEEPERSDQPSINDNLENSFQVPSDTSNIEEPGRSGAPSVNHPSGTNNSIEGFQTEVPTSQGNQRSLPRKNNRRNATDDNAVPKKRTKRNMRD